MKTALIVSGQFRDAKKCFDSIKEHILDKYNPDIFMHTWLPENKILDHRGVYLENDISLTEIIKSYKPKLCLVEDIDSPNSNAADNALSNIPQNSMHRIGYDGSHAWESKFSNVYFMYYSLYKAWSLKKNYENFNKVNYDFFIRIRFDVSYDEFPIFQPQINTLNIPLGHSARGGISDLLTCGENFVMDKYCQLYTKILDYYREGRSLHPESMLRYYLEEMNIKVSRFPLSYYLRGNKIEQYE